MAYTLFSFIQCWVRSVCYGAKKCLRQWTRPDNSSDSLAIGTARDLARSKSELVLENALLRQQLIVLQRHGKRPTLTWRDRALFVLLASKLPSWRTALLIVQPDTLLRWHRDLFRRVWRRKSKRKGETGRPPVAEDIVTLIKEMACPHLRMACHPRVAWKNRTWGAERIRGELLKLGITVAKSTIQTYVNQVRGPLSGKQTWSTFLRNHAQDIWACDFLQTYDLFFRTLFVFVVIELDSRRLVHFGVTRSPDDAWVAQQLWEATPFGEGPRFLIHDNDNKFGNAFARVADGTGIEVLTTPNLFQPVPASPGPGPAPPLPPRAAGGAARQGQDHRSPCPRWLASRLSATNTRQTLTPSRCLRVWRGIRSGHNCCPTQSHTKKLLFLGAPGRAEAYSPAEVDLPSDERPVRCYLTGLFAAST